MNEWMNEEVFFALQKKCNLNGIPNDCCTAKAKDGEKLWLWTALTSSENSSTKANRNENWMKIWDEKFCAPEYFRFFFAFWHIRSLSYIRKSRPRYQSFLYESAEKLKSIPNLMITIRTPHYYTKNTLYQLNWRNFQTQIPQRVNSTIFPMRAPTFSQCKSFPLPCETPRPVELFFSL